MSFQLSLMTRTVVRGLSLLSSAAVCAAAGTATKAATVSVRKAVRNFRVFITHILIGNVHVGARGYVRGTACTQRVSASDLENLTGSPGFPPRADRPLGGTIVGNYQTDHRDFYEWRQAEIVLARGGTISDEQWFNEISQAERHRLAWKGIVDTAEFLNEPEKDQKRIVETVTVPAGTLREAAHMPQETRT